LVKTFFISIKCIATVPNVRVRPIRCITKGEK
jgi:hypothetical protein